MPGRAVAARGILLAVVALLALAGPAAAARPGGKLVPASGALLGAYLDGWGQRPYTNVTDFESQLGRKLDIDHRYWAWRDGWPYFGSAPYHYERWDVENGRIPMVSWDYVGVGGLDAILNGSHDGVIRSAARKSAQFGQPFFLRWGYEMNGSWMPWSGAQNGRSAAKYVAAWRYLHDFFVAEGATNAVWVWAPNAQNSPNEAWNDFRAYYPGDEYVDWVGIDGYNWGRTESWSRWETFGEIFGPVYAAYANRKPIMIAEVGSTESGGSKADWLRETRAELQTRFPSIAAFVYFNYNHGGYDWELTTSTSAFEAFRELAADPYFNPSGLPPDAEPSPLPGTFPGAVRVRAKTLRPRHVRRIRFHVDERLRCRARRTLSSCRFETGTGAHPFDVSVAARSRRARRVPVRLGLSGYATRAVVFRVNRRVACVDRRAPYRCRVRVPQGRSTLRIHFRARTSLARETVARVRVSR